MKKTISVLLALALCLGLGAYVLEGNAAAAGPTGFTDVAEGAYYAAPVKWAVEKGITNGTSSDTFSPDIECTTAQIITFLWRAMGKPAPGIANPFSDVKEGAYYYAAALWACEKGMVSGKTFGPDTPCTRSQTVTYLWICAGKPSAKQASFSDVSSGADYAAAVSWAVEKGITKGTSATTFSPDSTCTRGQIVTFLHRDLGGAAVPAPDNGGTQRMARAMLDKLAELGEPEAYLVDMNADGTPELIYKGSDNDYHVWRWGGKELYEFYPERPYDLVTCHAIVKYHDEYAICYLGGAGAAEVYYLCFLDRMDVLNLGAEFIGYDEQGIPDYNDVYSYNGKKISSEQYHRLYKEYGLDNIKAGMDGFPSAKPELQKLLAG